MSELRFRVVETAFRKRPAHVEIPSERPSEYFARYVFNKEKMFKYLPGGVYAKLVDVIENNVPLDSGIADEVAAGMKRWAVEMGATHYTHWFHPLTEGTAEKHDAFVEPDGKGGMIEESCWYSRSRMRPVSRTGVSATRSKPADIRHGTLLLRPLSWMTLCVFRQCSLRIRGSRSTTRRLC